MIDRLFDRINLLEKGLDASWLKNDVIANNIANAETPGFKSSSVEFESVFREALSAREGGAVNLEPKVQRSGSSAQRMDGNSVDIDAEMAELAKNSILYDTLSYVASKELGRLRIIINEGK